ncbi:MAG: LysR family transcriptional regulator [Bacteroidales bacterium]|jgi:LysR family hydrogen peroxide-inducible transcriptional activator|nr:LysR family transcriptional regulator [Bacteroidales bacterium]
MVTLTQLEYIVAIDTYRSFGRAAERCFITQPTLSMQVRKLEDDLDIIIFDRTKQPLEPTVAGVRIIEQARAILRETAGINEIVMEYKNLRNGTLKIGVIPTLAPYLLPLFVGNYHRKYPDVTVNIEELTTGNIITALRHDLLDAGILVTPLHEAQVEEHPLFYEEMLLYMHPEHPLASCDEISVKDVHVGDLWLLGDSHCFRHQVVNLCAAGSDADNHLPFRFEAGSLETLMNIIDREGGMTLIPELATNGMSNERLLRVRSFDDATPLREVSVVHSRHVAKSRMLDLLCKEIVASIPKKLCDCNRGTLVEWRR